MEAINPEIIKKAEEKAKLMQEKGEAIFKEAIEAFKTSELEGVDGLATIFKEAIAGAVVSGYIMGMGDQK